MGKESQVQRLSQTGRLTGKQFTDHWFQNQPQIHLFLALLGKKELAFFFPSTEYGHKL